MPEDVRQRFYYVIIMPLNQDGHGPSTIRDACEITWEIWDQELVSHSSHKFLPDAIQECEYLNRVFYDKYGSNQGYMEANYA